jgi:Uma2 family endonuclease
MSSCRFRAPPCGSRSSCCPRPDSCGTNPRRGRSSKVSSNSSKESSSTCPSADRQQDTTVDVITVLGNWRHARREFVVAGNEAGMTLGGETRGADAAVWRRDGITTYAGKYRRVPPILAVEVQGELETEQMLTEKARWYLSRGVEVVWLLLPAERRVLVIDEGSAVQLGLGERVPARPSLPGLAPLVAELFEQVQEGALT